MMKIFNPKCVICFEKPNNYAFRQCGQRCFSEKCYQGKDDVDILECVSCRT